MKQQLNEGQVFGIFVVYSIIKKLCTPFESSDAFRLGIIDRDGNVLRKRSTLKTRQELDAYTPLDTLVFNLKKMIERIPGGKTRLASFSAALFLIKECHNYDLYTMNEELLEDDFNDFVSKFELTEDNKKMMELVDMAEDIANVGGAAVATDIPFKPKVKTKPEDLTKSLLSMYEELHGIGLVGHARKMKKVKEEIANVTGPAVATDVPFKGKKEDKALVFGDIERRKKA